MAGVCHLSNSVKRRSLKSRKEEPQLRRLDLPQQFSLIPGQFGPGRLLTCIHERERVPLTSRKEPPAERVFARQDLFGFTGQRSEARVLADAAKPILRVPIIGLPAVHNRVKIASIGIFNVLHDLVCLVEMVMPQEDGRAQERVGTRTQRTPQISHRLRARSPGRAQLWRLRGLQKLFDPGRHPWKPKSGTPTVKRVCC